MKKKSPQKKVILFMSKMTNPKADSQPYTCPDGGEVYGRQTNEAPVKYLLRKYEGKVKILCVVSRACRETLDWLGCSTQAYFRREIAQFCRDENLPTQDVFLEDVDFLEDNETDADAALVRDVSDGLKRGDEIILETTGGFRNSVIRLLLLSKILSYTGHPTIGAVYSFFDSRDKTKNRIYDVSDLVGLFELIGGMQELSSFGNVNALRAYYGKRPHDPKIDVLLSATKNLLDTITLCRTRQIPKAMKAFNDAMSAAETCQDAFLPQLLPAFRQKYGKYGSGMTIPDLIRWCVDSGMLQQALTIYKENIPEYLISRGDVLKVNPCAALPSDKPSYQSDSEAHFRRFGQLFSRQNPRRRSPDYTVLCSLEAMRNILSDYRRILKLRNMTNHASDTVTIKADGVKNAILRGLNNMNPKRINK